MVLKVAWEHEASGQGCHSPALDLSVEQPPGDLLVDRGLGHALSQQFAVT